MFSSLCNINFWLRDLGTGQAVCIFLNLSIDNLRVFQTRSVLEVLDANNFRAVTCLITSTRSYFMDGTGSLFFGCIRGRRGLFTAAVHLVDLCTLAASNASLASYSVLPDM
jgi:hypothetical protein